MKQSLSLITPVFNEPNIHNNLPIIDQELANTGLPYEIIAVNDGSDAVTTTLLNSVTLPRLKTFTYASNKGKGFALRYAFNQSQGNLVCFMDADLQLHPHQIALFTSLMNLMEADVVIGSKRHPMSQVEYGPRRRLYSWVYQQLVKLLFNLNLTDTQVGLKLFRRHVLKEIMPRLLVKQWAFDLELLVVAKHLGYKRIMEAPVNLTWKEGESNINWKVIPSIIQDTLAIFYRTYIKRQYNIDQTAESTETDYTPVLSSHQKPSFKKSEPLTEETTVREEKPITGVVYSARNQSLSPSASG